MTQILSTIGNIADSYPERNIAVRRLPRLRPPALLRELVRLAPGYDAALLFGAAGFRSAYVDHVAAAVIAKRGVPAVMTECYWELSSRRIAGLVHRRRAGEYDETPRSSGALARASIRLLDSGRLHYCVLSRTEEASFPTVWGIEPSRVHFTPFCFGINPSPLEPLGSGTIFAGGDSLRDYRALIAAGPTLPLPVVIATRLSAPLERGTMRLGPLPPGTYDTEMRSARIIVVPLRSDSLRSAGHQTYLSAMALGKPLVVTDSPGVRDYVDDGETGIIVPPNDPQRLAEAIRWILDDDNRAELTRMTERARTTALERYSLDSYLNRVLDVVEDAVAASSSRAAPS